MLAMLAAMRLRSDARDVGDIRMHLVGDLARIVIQQHIKRYSPDALSTYAGMAPLPICYVEAKSLSGTPKTPVQATASANSIGLPSPISYLPAGFELAISKGWFSLTRLLS